MQIINYNNQNRKLKNEQGIPSKPARKRNINEKPIKTNYKNITKNQSESHKLRIIEMAAIASIEYSKHLFECNL